MGHQTYCDCGAPRTDRGTWVFTCDVCSCEFRGRSESMGCVVGTVDLGNGWRLDLCRECWRILVVARGGSRAPELLRMAGGADEDPADSDAAT